MRRVWEERPLREEGGILFGGILFWKRKMLRQGSEQRGRGRGRGSDMK